MPKENWNSLRANGNFSVKRGNYSVMLQSIFIGSDESAKHV